MTPNDIAASELHPKECRCAACCEGRKNPKPLIADGRTKVLYESEEAYRKIGFQVEFASPDSHLGAEEKPKPFTIRRYGSNHHCNGKANQGARG